jgi:hypothetical protein
MTNQQHPIILPPELVEQWAAEAMKGWRTNGIYERDIATQAAQWGADQELDACCEWIPKNTPWDEDNLRAARRPKPLSLKKQALDAWDRLRNEAWCEEIDFDLDFVRRALEALPE